MKRRILSLLVENDVGVLAKISGLFSAKCYNLESLAVGETEDDTVSRITLQLRGDDNIFEQIKKQLNRCVEVIKVLDFTDSAAITKELLLVKIKNCTKDDKDEIFRIASVFNASVVGYGQKDIVIESVQPEKNNSELINVLKINFSSIEVVRGGSIAID